MSHSVLAFMLVIESVRILKPYMLGNGRIDMKGIKENESAKDGKREKKRFRYCHSNAIRFIYILSQRVNMRKSCHPSWKANASLCSWATHGALQSALIVHFSSKKAINRVKLLKSQPRQVSLATLQSIPYSIPYFR